MASVRSFGLTHDDKLAQNERNQASAMSVENLNSHNRTLARESYWFAHGGIEDISKNAQNLSKSTAPIDSKDAQLQKDKEERIRNFREQQEEERVKKMRDLEQQFIQAKKHREQQEEERKRRIEEARIKEMERRQQVEERKRQIWEAEQERKEAILRRNMEREARIEARRNAQRNSQCFAFGSSTPRTFDLDLAAIGVGRNTSPGSVLMSSVSRRSEEREMGPPRATSACSLDRKFSEDCMSRSMVSLSSSAFRGRKRTDIMPTLTRERSITPHVTPRGNCMRAVSMTRLDQLAQPRRSYRDTRTLYPSTTTTTTGNGGPRALSPSMTKSMCNLAVAPPIGRKFHMPMSNSQKGGNMSRSMMHLANSPQKDTQGLSPSPTLYKSNMRSAQSMMHLAAAPRLTRTARLRAEALAKSRAASAWNLTKPDASLSVRYLSPGKDTSRSPSRPQSSMSGASEISATSSSISAVNMRTRSAPRRPRPYSIAGSTTERSPLVPQNTIKKDPERQPRPIQPVVPKPTRTKSVGREKSEELSRPKKPVPPPKSKEVLARAKSHPVPTKDNLRKTVKSVSSTVVSNEDIKIENKEKNIVDEKENIKTNVKSLIEIKSDSVTEVVNSSPVISPVTDSEMCISSEDSRILTESDINICVQTFTEYESKTESSESVNVPVEKQNGYDKDANESNNIPINPEQKLISENINNEIIQESVNEPENIVVKETIPQKPRITSEEEARAALAEKRRLAREQAEREAELERQRQEEIRCKEEEQRRLEELEQKRMEEEAERLAELHRQLEAEKLKKAIEEQQQREKEEQVKREEEARQKAEKEEQERKAREEAEKQRLELKEKLRKEEEERAERKKRVEQIMARTRGKSVQSPALTANDDKNLKIENMTQNCNLIETKSNAFPSANDSTKVGLLSNGSSVVKIENSLSTSFTNNCVSSVNPFDNLKETNMSMSYSGPLPDLLNNEVISNHSVKNNGHHAKSDEQLVSSKISTSNNISPNRTMSANDVTTPTQTNGYSSHEDMSCTTSPEEISEAGLLIDVGNSQQSSKNVAESADFTKLVDIDQSSLNLNNENFLINVDTVNSNIMLTEKSYPGFDDCLQKKTDAPVVDLLS